MPGTQAACTNVAQAVQPAASPVVATFLLTYLQVSRRLSTPQA